MSNDGLEINAKTSLEQIDDSKNISQEVKAYLEDYKHVIEQVILNWEKPELFNSFINELGIDNRGNRQGFPHMVFSDIALLIKIHNELYGNHKEDESKPKEDYNSLELN